MEIDIAKECWLYALGNRDRLEVVRSVELRRTDAPYAPVAEFIRDHGLVQLSSLEVSDDRFMFGRVEHAVFVPAQVRNDVLAGTAISLPWLGAAACES